MKQSNPARSLLIVGNYPPPYGGVPHHIERVSGYLGERGWNCHVLSGGTSGCTKVGNVAVYKPGYPRKALGYARGILDSRYRRWLGPGSLPADMPDRWRQYAVYSDLGSEIIRKHRIEVIASYNLLSFAPIGGNLAEKFGLPHVISIFGEVFKFGDAMMRSKDFFATAPMNAFRLLSCSDHCGRSVRQLGVDRTVDTVTYGINVQHFVPAPDEAGTRAALGIGEEPVVLFVGRLGGEMGLDSFMAAARQLTGQFPDARFIMLGQAGELADSVEMECRALGEQFRLIRNVPYADLPKYYQVATLVAVPSRGDRTCSSLAAMEAMATGKAVVAFAVGGIPEIVDHERTGLLVPAGDVDLLAASIARLLEDDELRRMIAAAAYACAKEQFDERRVNTVMERHFLDALGHS